MRTTWLGAQALPGRSGSTRGASQTAAYDVDAAAFGVTSRVVSRFRSPAEAVGRLHRPRARVEITRSLPLPSAGADGSTAISTRWPCRCCTSIRHLARDDAVMSSTRDQRAWAPACARCLESRSIVAFSSCLRSSTAPSEHGRERRAQPCARCQELLLKWLTLRISCGRRIGLHHVSRARRPRAGAARRAWRLSMSTGLRAMPTTSSRPAR